MLSKNILQRVRIILAELVLLPALFIWIIPHGLIQDVAAMENGATLATFSDVPSTHPNYKAINYVHAQHIVDGYSDGTFRPDTLVNRAEFTKTIIEANYQGQANGSDCFPDVRTEWFAKYICFGKINSIVAGYPDGNFKPANTINFVEVAKILASAENFVITPDLTTWYRPYVEKLATLHAIPSSITSFNQNVTRGEVAEILYRLKTHLTDTSSRTYEELLQEETSIGVPVHLNIPSIHVDATIETVGLTPQGAVDVPKDPANAAWFSPSPRPGDNGSAVITGHINWYYGAVGVFANLRKIQSGDSITIQDDKGKTISFVVRETRNYDAKAEAVDVFHSYDGKAHLNLITCDGTWNSISKSYSRRLVIFADKQ